jgi:hypothetical protein
MTCWQLRVPSRHKTTKPESSKSYGIQVPEVSIPIAIRPVSSAVSSLIVYPETQVRPGSKHVSKVLDEILKADTLFRLFASKMLTTLRNPKALSLFILALTLSIALAQPDEVMLELGFNGEIIVNHWNPLRLVVRDQPVSELLISIDQGNLETAGTFLKTYRATIPASAGVVVFEDDIFIPRWRSLTWTLSHGERITASGSLDRRESRLEPLNLIISAQPIKWLNSWTSQRTIDMPPSLLPENLAAYDGVANLLVDGTAPMPKLEAIISAASAGATIWLVPPLPESHRELAALLSNEPQRLGAGWVISQSPLEASQPASLDIAKLATALLDDDLVKRPKVSAQLPVLAFAAIYGLLILALLRFAAVPGLLTGLLLSLLACMLAWNWLRPQASQSILGRSLSIGGGELARRLELRSVFTLPSGKISLPISAQLLQLYAYEQKADTLSLEAQRWSALSFMLRPQLEPSQLRWRAGQLSNSSTTPLSDVYVKGLGPQGDLAAGATRAVSSQEETVLLEIYERLLEHLPEHSAIARHDGQIHVALPEANTTLAGLEPLTELIPCSFLSKPASG